MALKTQSSIIVAIIKKKKVTHMLCGCYYKKQRI